MQQILNICCWLDRIIKPLSISSACFNSFPYNGEPPRKRLVQTEITPNKDFFVRNHGGIPEIDISAYDFDIEGLVNNPKKLTLADLQNEKLFKK